MSVAAKVVELYPAFAWTCDGCGRDNFARGRRIEPESDEFREVNELVQHAQAEMNEHAEVFGMTVGGDWLTAPSEVTCPHCGTAFATEEV